MTRHGVMDRMTGEVVYRTKRGTFEETHKRAEKWCRHNLKERGTIVEIPEEVPIG